VKKQLNHEKDLLESLNTYVKKQLNPKKNCPVCNKTFVDKSHNKVVKVCSKECRRLRFNELNRKNYHKNKIKIEKTCPICNKSFFSSDRRQVYCSKECIQNEKKIEKTCPICNNSFTTNNPIKLYCSKECFKKHKNLVISLRTRIIKACKAKNTHKQKRSMELLGCSIEEFKQHMERQFSEGMSWDNHGEWHIDHIKPVSLFDLTQEAEQLKAFHYSNCQPLWANDNFKKSNNYYQEGLIE